MKKPLFSFCFTTNPNRKATDTRDKTAQMLRTFKQPRTGYKVTRTAAHDYQITVKGSPALACRIYLEAEQ
jgi:hypothetical protein